MPIMKKKILRDSEALEAYPIWRLCGGGGVVVFLNLDSGPLARGGDCLFLFKVFFLNPHYGVRSLKPV